MLKYALGLVPLKKENVWYGESYSTGFILKKDGDFTNYNVGSSKEMEELTDNKILFFSPIIFTFVISFWLDFYFNGFFPFTVFAPILLATGILIGISFNMTRENKQWHACEHKSVILLRYEKETTLQNLKLAPKTLIGCGSSVCTLGLQLGASAIIFGLSTSLMAYLWLVSTVCFVMYLFIFSNFRYLLLVPSFPAMAISLCAEKFLFLKEPTEEQYRQTEKELNAHLSKGAE